MKRGTITMLMAAILAAGVLLSVMAIAITTGDAEADLVEGVDYVLFEDLDPEEQREIVQRLSGDDFWKDGVQMVNVGTGTVVDLSPEEMRDLRQWLQNEGRVAFTATEIAAFTSAYAWGSNHAQDASCWEECWLEEHCFNEPLEGFIVPASGSITTWGLIAGAGLSNPAAGTGAVVVAFAACVTPAATGCLIGCQGGSQSACGSATCKESCGPGEVETGFYCPMVSEIWTCCAVPGDEDVHCAQSGANCVHGPTCPAGSSQTGSCTIKGVSGSCCLYS